MEDSCIQVLHGWAHTSRIPFDLTRGWTRPNRVLSGNIFYEPTPIRWSPDRNFFWAGKLSFQRALDTIMSSGCFPSEILVELMTFCGMDWFDGSDLDPKLENDYQSDSLPSVISMDSNRSSRSGDDNQRRQTSVNTIVHRISGIFNNFTLLRSNSAPTPIAPPSSESQQVETDEKAPCPVDQQENNSDVESDEKVPSMIMKLSRIF